MCKVPFAEWFLAQGIGAERGAALYGDLEELAVTRGRVWFWSAYVRALISFGWRTSGAAFILAFLLVRSHWLNTALFSWMRWHFRWLPREPGFHGSYMVLMLANILVGLVFLLPFVLIRFGIGDRLSRLTCAIFLLSLPLFSLRPPAIQFAGAAIAIVGAAALCIRGWRRPMIVLVLTLIVRLEIISFPYRWAVSHGGYTALYLIAYVATAMACLWLHRRLMEGRVRVEPGEPGNTGGVHA